MMRQETIVCRITIQHYSWQYWESTLFTTSKRNYDIPIQQSGSNNYNERIFHIGQLIASNCPKESKHFLF